jgi:hypothetical protein
MRYAQTGIHSYVPPGGACTGHRYEDRPDRDNERMSVDCERCEPHLAKDPLWASSPSEVPLTDREQKAAEASKSTFDAVAAQAVAGLAAAFAQGGLNLAQVASSVAPAAAAALPGGGADAASGAARKASRPRKTAAKTPASA